MHPNHFSGCMPISRSSPTRWRVLKVCPGDIPAAQTFAVRFAVSRRPRVVCCVRAPLAVACPLAALLGGLCLCFLSRHPTLVCLFPAPCAARGGRSARASGPHALAAALGRPSRGGPHLRAVYRSAIHGLTTPSCIGQEFRFANTARTQRGSCPRVRPSFHPRRGWHSYQHGLRCHVGRLGVRHERGAEGAGFFPSL